MNFVEKVIQNLFKLFFFFLQHFHDKILKTDFLSPDRGSKSQETLEGKGDYNHKKIAFVINFENKGRFIKAD